MKLPGLFTTLALILAFANVGTAQDSGVTADLSNFSGRWVSESVKVMSDSRPMRSTTDSNLKIELLIEQSGNELRVKESTTGSGSYSRDLIYYLDGRGESNKGFTAGFEYESKAILKDRKIFIKAVVKVPASRGSLVQNEEWELSKDGKTLTIITNNAGSNSAPSTGSPKSVIRYEKIFRLAI